MLSLYLSWDYYDGGGIRRGAGGQKEDEEEGKGYVWWSGLEFRWLWPAMTKSKSAIIGSAIHITCANPRFGGCFRWKKEPNIPGSGHGINYSMMYLSKTVRSQDGRRWMYVYTALRNATKPVHPIRPVYIKKGIKRKRKKLGYNNIPQCKSTYPYTANVTPGCPITNPFQTL